MLWLGVDEPRVRMLASATDEGGTGWVNVPLPSGAMVAGRMHLTREQVSVLLPLLQAFVATGEIRSACEASGDAGRECSTAWQAWAHDLLEDLGRHPLPWRQASRAAAACADCECAQFTSGAADLAPPLSREQAARLERDIALARSERFSR